MANADDKDKLLALIEESGRAIQKAQKYISDLRSGRALPTGEAREEMIAASQRSIARVEDDIRKLYEELDNLKVEQKTEE
jgi:hypothetical protein